MAEIEIKKKEKPIWPWIIGILVVLAIVAWLFFRNRDTNERTEEIGYQKAAIESIFIVHKKPVFPEYVPIRLEAYLA